MSKGIIYRAFRVNHRDLTLTHLGDFEDKDDADMAVHLDLSDEPSPDKYEFYSWHIHGIYHKLKREVK